MAPQESNVVLGSKRPPQYSELFSLPLMKKRKKNKNKKKQTNAAGHNSIFNKPRDKSSNAAVEVITLDSDDSPDGFEKPDDDVIIVENPVENIDLSHHETEELDHSHAGDGNITININQPIDIDHILSSKTETSVTIDSSRENDVSETRIDSSTLITDHPKAWTKDMINYYTQPCEKYRNFDYKEILKTIKYKPSEWYINSADKYGTPHQKRRYLPCRKCRRNGHTEKECKKNIVCYICGDFSHIYLRCPNSLCLTCGNPTSKNIKRCNNCQKFLSSKQSCGLCGQMYHSEQLCPSRWRQYLILSDSTVPAKPNPRKFCYNCAEKGHFGFECSRTPYSEYPAENPIITTLVNRDYPLKQDGDHFDDDNNNRRNAVIPLCERTTDLLSVDAGNQFLRNFSDNHNLRVEFYQSPRAYIKISGVKDAINTFRRELHSWKTQFTGAALF